MLWTATISDAASDKGFAVRLIRQHDGDSGDKFYDWAIHKDIWGLYMFGHGVVNISWFGVDSTYPYNGGFEWDDNKFYCADDLNAALIYGGRSNRQRYGLLVAYFCYANYNKWRLLVSNQGSYYGGNGSVFVASGPRSVSGWMTWRAMFNDAAKVK